MLTLICRGWRGQACIA